MWCVRSATVLACSRESAVKCAASISRARQRVPHHFTRTLRVEATEQWFLPTSRRRIAVAALLSAGRCLFWIDDSTRISAGTAQRCASAAPPPPVCSGPAPAGPPSRVDDDDIPSVSWLSASAWDRPREYRPRFLCGTPSACPRPRMLPWFCGRVSGFIWGPLCVRPGVLSFHSVFFMGRLMLGHLDSWLPSSGG